MLPWRHCLAVSCTRSTQNEGAWHAPRVLLRLGGLGRFANESKVKILRTAPDGSKQTLIVDVGTILKNGSFDQDVPLVNGDVIIVPEKLLSF